MWRLSYSMPLWAKGVEQEIGWNLQRLFQLPRNAEIVFLPDKQIKDLFKKIVGERMKKLREEAGISQNKLAKLIGIQQSSLNRYESGFSNPTPETLLWFGDFFDVSMDYIFGRTDKPQGKMYKYKPRLDPDMMKFVEMCFEPGTRANRELRASLLKMMTEEKK